jgi:hypothetical protein
VPVEPLFETAWGLPSPLDLAPACGHVILLEVRRAQKEGSVGRGAGWLGWMASWLALAVVCLSPFPARPAAARHPEWSEVSVTQSYYVATESTTALNHLGCDTATKGREGRMTLFFGSPVEVGGTFGATLFGAYATTTGVRDLVRAFIRGYHGCASGAIFMRLGVGISNCLIGGASATVCQSSPAETWVRDHGEAWGLMVNGLRTWVVNNGYNARVAIYAGWDMEPSWSSFARADAWMHGFDFDAPNGAALHANFSADGCPPYGSCSNGWTQFRMWHESWEHISKLALSADLCGERCERRSVVRAKRVRIPLTRRAASDILRDSHTARRVQRHGRLYWN